MAGNIERGGTGIGRWPADMPEEDERSRSAPAEGAVEGLAGESDLAGADTGGGMPGHEVDPDTEVGGGMTGAGGSATDYGHDTTGGQMDPDTERHSGDDSGGLPLGDSTSGR